MNTILTFLLQDFVSADVRYEKIRCIGREIPSNDIYERYTGNQGWLIILIVSVVTSYTVITQHIVR